jgi:hypothetical protein
MIEYKFPRKPDNSWRREHFRMFRSPTPEEILREEKREERRIWEAKRKVVSDFIANSRFILDPPEVDKNSAAGFLYDFVDFKSAAASDGRFSPEEREIISGIEFEEVVEIIEAWIKEGPSCIVSQNKSMEFQGIYFGSVRRLQDTIKLARYANENISTSTQEE